MFLLFKFLVSLYVFCKIYLLQVDQNNLYQPETLKLQYEVPRNILKEDKWISIGNPANRRKIYSAYYDDRPFMRRLYTSGIGRTVGIVQIISILPYCISENNLTCYFRYSNGDVKKANSLAVKAIRENEGLAFSASFITCGVNTNITNTTTAPIQLPEFVAVSDSSLHVEYLQYIPVRYPLKSNEPSDKTSLAVCVPPLFNHYNNDLFVTEYIEIYRILGVKHFFFYNSSMSDRVSTVLQYYQNKGLATVQNWTFNGYKFEEEVRYNGIFAALNDCLYRASFVHGFEYVVNTDIDEILIPHQDKDLLQLLSKVKPSEAGIIFRNAFFDIFAENKTSTRGKNFLITQSKLIRTRDNFPPRKRSKYIYKGKGIIELGNHLIGRYYPGFRHLFLTEDEGLSHHYRYGCLGYCTPDNLIIDSTALQYQAQLVNNVDKTYAEIFDKK